MNRTERIQMLMAVIAGIILIFAMAQPAHAQEATLPAETLLGRIAETEPDGRFEQAPLFNALSVLQAEGKISNEERKTIARKAMAAKQKSFSHANGKLITVASPGYPYWPEKAPPKRWRTIRTADLENLNLILKPHEKVVAVTAAKFAGDYSGKQNSSEENGTSYLEVVDFIVLIENTKI